MYNKIFTKILDSSIWLEPTPTRIVWVTLLAAMDQDGYAHFSAIGNLANRARVTEDEAQAAVDCFLAPDASSADEEFEGRRIERVPGGFLVLNATKYRDLVTSAVVREQVRERVRRFREKRSVTLGNGKAKKVTQSEAETRSKADEKKKQPPAAALPEWINPDAWAGFAEMRTRKRATMTKRAAEMIVRKLEKLRTDGEDPNAVLDQSTRNSWTDVYAVKQETNGKPVPKTVALMHTLEAMKDDIRNRADDSGPRPAIDLPRVGRSAGG